AHIGDCPTSPNNLAQPLKPVRVGYYSRLWGEHHDELLSIRRDVVLPAVVLRRLHKSFDGQLHGNGGGKSRLGLDCRREQSIIAVEVERLAIRRPQRMTAAPFRDTKLG